MTNTAKVSENPTGNNPPPEAEFPLPILRRFLLPDQTVSFKSFEAGSLEELDRVINDWVDSTKAIIAIPAQLNKRRDNDGVKYMISLTYIKASEGAE